MKRLLKFALYFLGGMFVLGLVVRLTGYKPPEEPPVMVAAATSEPARTTDPPVLPAGEALVTYLRDKLAPLRPSRIELRGKVLRIEPEEKGISENVFETIMAPTCEHVAGRPELKTLSEIHIVNKFDKGWVFEEPIRCEDVVKAKPGTVEWKAYLLGRTHYK